MADLKVAVDRGIRYAPAYWIYALQLLEEGKAVEAEYVLSRGYRRSPQLDPSYFAVLIVTEVKLGKYPEALRFERQAPFAALQEPLRGMTRQALITARKQVGGGK